jgi:uncharacterized protein
VICETDTETLVEYDRSPRPCFPLLAEMMVERGSKADWELLHDLHYKAENLPSAPRFWKLTLRGETIGVIVTASPKGLLKERHVAFPILKPGNHDTYATNKHRYVWLNQNVRVISRFVLDTMYRGIGAGYRFQNLASRLEGFRFMEIQSSMSKFNFFAQKAGFRFVRPMNSNHYDQGLKFFRSHFAANPQDFEAIVAEIEAMAPTVQERILGETRIFYLRHSALENTGNNRARGEARVQAMSIRVLVKSLQQLILASPMYGVWENPDLGRTLPPSLPLTAFDHQGVRESLKLELLHVH